MQKVYKDLLVSSYMNEKEWRDIWWCDLTATHFESMYLWLCLIYWSAYPSPDQTQRETQLWSLTVNNTTIIWYPLVDVPNSNPEQTQMNLSAVLRFSEAVDPAGTRWQYSPWGGDDALWSFSCSARPAAWWLSTDSISAGTRLHRLTGTYRQPEPERKHKHKVRIYKKVEGH